MRRIHVSFICCIIVVLFLPATAQQLKPVAPVKVGMSAERLQRLTDALDGYVIDGKLSGAVALVARRGKLAYMKAVGYRDIE